MHYRAIKNKDYHIKYVCGQNKMTTEQGQEKECQNPWKRTESFLLVGLGSLQRYLTDLKTS